MSWINIASRRYELESRALDSIEMWEKKPDLRTIGFSPALHAAMAGRQDIFDRALPLSLQLLEKLSANDDENLSIAPVLGDVIGLACIAHIAGHNQRTLFERIARLKNLDEQINRVLHQVVVKLVSDDTKSDDEGAVKLGHVHTEAAWFKAVGVLPVHHTLNMALCPDHPLWLRVLRHFVLPLALLVTQQKPHLQPLDLLRLGAYPDLHTQVLYERVSPKPAWATKLDVSNPATWPGFDAIEVRNSELLLYHYLGFTWQAPLVFEGEKLNAFQFLEQLDFDWKIVQQTLPSVEWKKLEDIRGTIPQFHVVVHDRTLSKYLPGHMKRAAEHYGIQLREADVTEL